LSASTLPRHPLAGAAAQVDGGNVVVVVVIAVVDVVGLDDVVVIDEVVVEEVVAVEELLVVDVVVVVDELLEVDGVLVLEELLVLVDEELLVLDDVELEVLDDVELDVTVVVVVGRFTDACKKSRMTSWAVIAREKKRTSSICPLKDRSARTGSRPMAPVA